MTNYYVFGWEYAKSHNWTELSEFEREELYNVVADDVLSVRKKASEHIIDREFAAAVEGALDAIEHTIAVCKQ